MIEADFAVRRIGFLATLAGPAPRLHSAMPEHAGAPASGGGIVSTVEATRRASREELAALITHRLDEMLLCGTTTAEVKSGYGLETEAELRSLEAIRLAATGHPVDVVATFLGGPEGAPEARPPRTRAVDK